MAWCSMSNRPQPEPMMTLSGQNDYQISRFLENVSVYPTVGCQSCYKDIADKQQIHGRWVNITIVVTGQDSSL